jgi:hypothetical protein
MRLLVTVILIFISMGSLGGEEPSANKEPSAGTEPSAEKQPSAEIKQTQSPEQLIATAPDKWNLVYQMNNSSSRLSDYVPPGETDESWSTKLSFESFRDMVDMDPIQILLAEAANDNEHCKFIQHFSLYSGYENNYPSSVRLFFCGENTFVNKGEIKMVKAIQGDDYFYLIKILKRVDPFETNQPGFAKEEIAVWSSYLRNITLCNSKKADHPCPAK